MYLKLLKIGLLTTALSTISVLSYAQDMPEGAVIYQEASDIGDQKIVTYNRNQLMTARSLLWNLLLW